MFNALKLPESIKIKMILISLIRDIIDISKSKYSKNALAILLRSELTCQHKKYSDALFIYLFLVFEKYRLHQTEKYSSPTLK